MSFVHLQVSSAFSLLSSTASVKSLVHKAVQHQYRAIAITDRNVMYGVVPFYQECRKNGIKPIIGMTVDVMSENEEGSFPLILLAKNNAGYRNLLKISSVIGTKSPEGIPHKWLKGYREGLIGITPGIKGEIEQQLLAGSHEKAEEAFMKMLKIFGEDSFYLSLQNHGLQDERTIEEGIQKLGEKYGVKQVVTNDVQFVEKDDAFAQECLLAIRDGVKLADDDREILESDQYYFKSKDEMLELFGRHVDALENTMNVANECNVEIAFNQNLLPKYPLPSGQSADPYLEEVCLKGLKERGLENAGEYTDRLKYELSIIQKMNFSDYFLIVWDFMKFAREQHILTGPGRGSAAGSLVAYILKITDVDPIVHGLLFERFLNPERVSMPDIDIDFPDYRREEVIEYVHRKYGDLHVAQIITFGTLAAKAALRDTARVFGYNSKELEQLSKFVPSRHGLSLKSAYDESAEFRDFINESQHKQRLFSTALKLEGLPRHASTHAAGIIISERPLVDLIPIQAGQGNVHLTQYPMEILEEIGLLKMDFLGLRNLTILDRIVTSIRKGTGKNLSLDALPKNDEKTFQLLSQGRTDGVFQLESDGMKNVLVKLRPSSFEDIVAVNALFRPGPMENIPLFISRKHGEESINYPHEDLNEILGLTYGVIVYQEQIMQIASKMAGFTLGEADLLRRAVSKKKRDVLDSERKHFIDGALKKGYTFKTAEEIYDLIVRFANYGFNRSHAVAYSMIAYQLAYLKANYPSYFLAALLTSVVGNDTKVSQYIREAKQNDIDILPPSINLSQFPFKVEKGGIRYSLGAIRGVGAAALKEIYKERQGKPFPDLFDFCLRVSVKAVNRKTLEALVFSGALDDFGEDRSTLLASLDVAIEHAELVRPQDQDYDLFEEEEAFLLKPKYTEVEGMPLEKKLEYEKQVLGLYLSDHPVTPYEDLFKDMSAIDLFDLEAGNKNIRAGVYITALKTIRTKKGEVMAFITVSDSSGEMEGVVFPNAYKQNSALIKEGNILMLEGSVEERNDKMQLLVNKAFSIEEVKSLSSEINKRLYLKVNHSAGEAIEAVKRILKKHKGRIPVIIHFDGENRTVQLPNNQWVNPSAECLRELKETLGERNTVLK
ncbi:DNA polymerase III subunit alpha [Rossellomorea vietnamensis]|uniref:DNA polymerase III subunit alpha n=1 Tax=Rossellomorea vietnamensis TaxID=218284 RepID=A0A5D4KJB0_9BACI|nr:DNA polymerase III subunit alpha [Rossellomorea vietnamensis]TYR76940.1 DNA polymerase III subunit alpha [Rossellomorea vietnamensis]